MASLYAIVENTDFPCVASVGCKPVNSVRGEALMPNGCKNRVSSSQSMNQDVVVLDGSNLTLLTSCGYQSAMNHDTILDVASWSNNNEHFIVADSMGFIYIINKQLKIVFSHAVLKGDDLCEASSCFHSASITYNKQGNHTIAVGACDGRVFIYSNFNLGRLSKGANGGNKSVELEVKRNMKEYQFDTTSYHSVKFNSLLACAGHAAAYFTAGSGENLLVRWESDSHVKGLALPPGGGNYTAVATVEQDILSWLPGNCKCDNFVKMVQALDSLFCMDNKGHLFEFEVHNLFLLKCYDSVTFFDFAVKMSPSLTRQESLKMGRVFGFAKDPTTDAEVAVVYRLSDMEAIFTAPCTKTAAFASPPADFDDLFFTDGPTLGTEEKQAKLSIKSIREASPEGRLLILLQQHRFQDALEFASKYDLDAQPVYKQEASFILHSIGEETNDDLRLAQFANFRKIIVKVQDAVFVGELCTNVSLSDISMTFDLLSLVRDVLDGGGRFYRASVADSDDVNEELHLRTETDRLLNLLVTFQMAFDDISTVSWQAFRSQPLPQQVALLLMSGNLQAATVVCSRHEPELMTYLEEDGEKRLSALLGFVTDDVDSNALVSWLEHVIPALLSSNIRRCVEIIASWLRKRAECLEETFPEKWPENGLNLANVFFKVQKRLSKLGFIREVFSPAFLVLKNKSEEVCQLQLLISRLKSLSRIRSRFQCSISLHEFVKETTASLTFRMLDEVSAPELIARCLEGTVRPYMREQQLNEDDTLLLYVQDIMSHCPETTWGAFQSLRERKVMAVVKCMKDQKVIVEATALLAKKASVPWSSDTARLIDQASLIAGRMAEDEALDETSKALFKRLQEDLQYCTHLEKVSTIAAKYGRAEHVQRHSSYYERLARHLVTQESDEALVDAVQIARCFTDAPEELVYAHRLNYLVNKEKVSECIKIVDTFPDIAIKLTQRLKVRTLIMLDLTHPMWTKERERYCSACSHVMEHVIGKMGDSLSWSLEEEWRDDLTIIQDIYAVQKHRGELISVKDYHSGEWRDRLLDKQVLHSYQHIASPAQSAVVHSNVSQLTQTSNHDVSSLNQSKQSPGVDSTGDNRSSCKVSSRPSSVSAILSSKLLRVSQQVLLAKTAIHAAKKCQGKAAIQICRDLFQASQCPATANALQEVLLILLDHLRSHPYEISPLLSDMKDLSDMAMTCCTDDALCNILSLSRLCRMASLINSATDTSAQERLSQCMMSAPKTRRSRYEHTEWLFDWYQEDDGVNLKSSDVLPLLALLKTYFFDSKGTVLAQTHARSLREAKETLMNVGKVSMQMTAHLKNSGRSFMALQWIMLSLNLTVSHLSKTATFCKNSPEFQTIMAMILQTIRKGAAERSNCVEMLLEKVLLRRNPDIELAIGLLVDLESECAFQLLNNIHQAVTSNYQQTSAIARVGLAVAKRHGVLSHVAEYESLHLDAKWAQKLASLKVDLHGFLCATQQWKHRFLLTRLLRHQSISGAFIQDYCKDYGLDSDGALLSYIDALLGTGLPPGGDSQAGNHLVEFNPASQMLLTITSSYRSKQSTIDGGRGPERPWDEVQQELKWVVRRIENRYELLAQLERSLRDHVTPYDYDRAEFLLQLIQSCESVAEGHVDVIKGLKLITCLRHIKRRKPPSDYEVRRMWRRDYREILNQPLPELSKERLPLHPLLYGDSAHAWKILSPEVDAKSAASLVLVAKELGLKVDAVYMTAAENLVARYTSSDENKEGAASLVLDDVRSLTDKIESCEMAVAMAKRVAELLPAGKDKVEAYRWCLSLVTRWRDSLPEESTARATVNNAHQTLMRSYKLSSTESVLQEHELNAANYLQLAGQPDNLIVALYHHPSIVQRFYDPDGKYADIHTVVDRIATTYDQDVDKIRLSLIVKLLLSANKVQENHHDNDDDTTVNIERIRRNGLEVNSREKEEDQEGLIRLLYLLKCKNIEQQAKYLVRLISDSSKKVNNATRVLALDCLFHIADDQLIYSLTGKRADDLRNELRILVYLTELETAHFKVRVAHLKSDDKLSVVRSIVTSPAHRHNPVALRTAAEMCREFGLVAADTWSVVLQQLVTLQQVTYLQQLLPDICCNPTVRSITCLATVWQSCVTLPLVALTPPLERQQVEICLTSYHFLLKCPVLLRINLGSVAKHFAAVELHALALGCMLASPGERNRASEFARSMSHEIRLQLRELHSDERPLLGHALIDNFLRKVEA